MYVERMRRDREGATKMKSLSKAMIATLKTEYAKINTVNPDTFEKARDLIAMLSSTDLKKIIKAEVKFLDTASMTELFKRGEATEAERQEYTARKLTKWLTAE